MLTKTDLLQIRKVVREEIESTNRTVKILQYEVSIIKKDVQGLKKDMAKVKKDLNLVVSFFDHEYLDLQKRIERIENYLKLPPLPLAS